MSGSTETTQEAVNIPKWFIRLLGWVLIPIATGAIWMTISIVSHESRIASLESGREEVLKTLKDQTIEIVELRLQIERLLVIKPSDVYRKLEEVERKINEYQNKETK